MILQQNSKSNYIESKQIKKDIPVILSNHFTGDEAGLGIIRCASQFPIHNRLTFEEVWKLSRILIQHCARFCALVYKLLSFSWKSRLIV
jgi:hypothetical protein